MDTADNEDQPISFFRKVILFGIGSLVVANSQIFTQLSKNDEGTFSFSLPAIVRCVEVLKTVIALICLIIERGTRDAISLITHTPIRHWLLYLVPAACYTITNNFVIKSGEFMDAASVVMLQQLKVFTTAVLWFLVFNQRPTRLQIFALVLLTLGGMLSAVPSRNTQMHVELLGLVLISITAITSAIAGVYLEWLYKNIGAAESLNLQNIYIYSMGTLWNSSFFMIFQKDCRFFEGWNWWAVALILNMSAMGLIIAVVLKHFSNIHKLFMCGGALYFCVLYDIYLAELSISPSYCLSLFLVSISLYLYHCEQYHSKDGDLAPMMHSHIKCTNGFGSCRIRFPVFILCTLMIAVFFFILICFVGTHGEDLLSKPAEKAYDEFKFLHEVSPNLTFEVFLKYKNMDESLRSYLKKIHKKDLHENDQMMKNLRIDQSFPSSKVGIKQDSTLENNMISQVEVGRQKKLEITKGEAPEIQTKIPSNPSWKDCQRNLTRCNISSKCEKPWSERDAKDNCCSDILFSMLIDLISVMEKHNIQPCIFFGTLIGSLRDKDVIAWTPDIDLGLDFKTYSTWLQWKKYLNEAGYIIFNEGVLRVCRASNSRSTNTHAPWGMEWFPYIDLYYFEEMNGAVYTKQVDPMIEWPRDYLWPYSKCEIRGLEFPCPNKGALILDSKNHNRYHDWRKKRKSGMILKDGDSKNGNLVIMRRSEISEK